MLGADVVVVQRNGLAQRELEDLLPLAGQPRPDPGSAFDRLGIDTSQHLLEVDADAREGRSVLLPQAVDVAVPPRLDLREQLVHRGAEIGKDPDGQRVGLAQQRDEEVFRADL